MRSVKRTGPSIARFVRKMHPDATHVIPLYRSAIVLVPLDKGKNLRAILYGDPLVTGKNYTRKNFRALSMAMEFTGCRWGPIVERLSQGERLELAR